MNGCSYAIRRRNVRTAAMQRRRAGGRFAGEWLSISRDGEQTSTQVSVVARQLIGAVTRWFRQCYTSYVSFDTWIAELSALREGCGRSMYGRSRGNNHDSVVYKFLS